MIPVHVSSLKFSTTCPQPVTGLVSRLVFAGLIPILHTVVSKSSETDIWLSSYDHLTDVGGQRIYCSERVRAFYSTRKKLENGLIQVNDNEERKG